MTRKRLFVRGAAIAGAMCLLYVAGWFIVSGILKSGIVGWVSARQAEGWTVKHGDISMTGFPYSWNGNVDTPNFAKSEGARNIQWSGPTIALKWKPWNPRTIHFVTSGAHKFRLMPEDTTDLLETDIDIASGQGRLEFGPQGQLHRLTMLLEGASVQLPKSDLLKVTQFQTTVDINQTRTEGASTPPHQTPLFTLDGEIFGLTFPKGRQFPLGRTIGRLALRGTVLGRLQPGRPSQVLRAWQADGGTLEIGHLDLGWGPLDVRSTGTVALDKALQPVAALTGKFTGYYETVDAMVSAQLIKPRIARISKFALGAIARPTGPGGRAEVKAPITLQDGWLKVGPIQLLQVPTISWD